MVPRAMPVQRHADGAERNEAVFNFVAAEQAGDHAADADADGESGVEIAGLSLADVENIGTVDDDGGEEQRAKEPEVGVAEDREEERLIAAHELDLLPEIANEVQAEFLLGCGGRNAIDAEAGGEAERRRGRGARIRRRLRGRGSARPWRRR